MRLEQWGVGKEHHRMASECPEYVIAIGVPIIKTSVVNEAVSYTHLTLPTNREV